MASPDISPDPELAREEQRLAELRAQVEAQEARVRSLREGTCRVPDTVAAPVASPPATNAEKIRLFRSLFRGREDVFARRWENPKTGKSGYAPACANEWVPAVCIKRADMGIAGRRGTCGECTAQAYLPLTDEELAAHLRGQQVLGVYPMLPDETCRFLAADFDDDGWTGDVTAFRETCDALGVPVAVERSRSGNGAHAWVFFSAPVAAVVARQLGCFLLTETMARRHQLAMASYDRLFPNQDTMPKGGFGNLIALPLQRAARDSGNSTFVDRNLVPFADPWAFLAGMARMAPGEVKLLAENALRSGRVLEVRQVITGDDEIAPWEMPPSGRPPKLRIAEPLPEAAHAVIAQRLYLEKAGLPSPLLSRIKRIAAFQNPEFYKKQGLRLSTALTPRVISCAEERAEYLVLPRGCADEVAAELAELGIALRLDDRREAGTPIEARFDGVLTEAQSQAAQSLLEHDSGILVAPPGSGKTVIGASLIAARGRNTLVLVHRKPLMDQWVAQLALFLGLAPREIGRIGGGHRKVTGRIDVAMLQSLVSKGGVADLVAGYGHVVVDECHHVPAVSFERILGEVRSRYLTGLTATPVRRDGHHPILEMQMGAVRHTMGGARRGQAAPLVCRLVVRNTGFQPGADDAGQGIQSLYARLATDAMRNYQIVADVRAALAEGRSPLVLTERRDHLECLSIALGDAASHLATLYGGMGAKARRQALTHLTGAPASESRLVLATGRYIGEGFDDARLDTLFLALPVSWKGTLVQYAGRLHRLREGKTEVRIYDYVDRDVGMLRRMFERRLKGYRAMGYAADEAGRLLFE